MLAVKKLKKIIKYLSVIILILIFISGTSLSRIERSATTTRQKTYLIIAFIKVYQNIEDNEVARWVEEVLQKPVKEEWYYYSTTNAFRISCENPKDTKAFAIRSLYTIKDDIKSLEYLPKLLDIQYNEHNELRSEDSEFIKELQLYVYDTKHNHDITVENLKK